MNTEATTLYKLMVLYMLSKVNFPLSNSQISEFMLDKQYTTYFALQEVLNALTEDGFIQVLTYRNSTQYKLTPEGTDTISFFNNKISSGIRDDIDEYLKNNKYDLKCEVGTTSDYYRTTNGDYIVHCQVKEGDTNLIELNVAVPLEEQADVMCSKWRDASQEIYEFVMHKLM
jgi:DNA-binding HxlR family transcriptional regulator